MDRPATLPAPERCPDCGYDRRGLDEDRPCPECGFRTGPGAVLLVGRGFHGRAGRWLGLSLLFYGLGLPPLIGGPAAGMIAIAGLVTIGFSVARGRSPESAAQPDRLVLTVEGVGRGLAGERLAAVAWSDVVRFRVSGVFRWRLTRTARTGPTAVVSVVTRPGTMGRQRGRDVRFMCELPRGGIEDLRSHGMALFAASRAPRAEAGPSAEPPGPGDR